MNARVLGGWVCGVVLATGCRDAPPPTDRAPAATERPAVASPDLEFIEFTTAGADPAQPLPLVIALHGLGDRPESFAGWLRELPAPARVYVLRAPTAYGRGYTWFPPASVGPVVDAAAIAPGVRAAAERVAANLGPLAARRPTRGKPIVTGFSQGGMISFALAALAPDRITAALPIGGVLGTSIEVPAAPASAPRLVAFHGADDERVPVALARSSIERFRQRGWRVELREYPGVGHSIGASERREIWETLVSAIAP